MVPILLMNQPLLGSLPRFFRWLAVARRGLDDGQKDRLERGQVARVLVEVVARRRPNPV